MRTSFSLHKSFLFVGISVFLLIATRIVVLRYGVDYTGPGITEKIPLYNILLNYLPDIFFRPGWLSMLFSFITVLISGIYIHTIAIQHKLIDRKNYLPISIFFILSCAYPPFLLFSPDWIALLLCLILGGSMLSLSNEKTIYGRVFNLGFFASVIFLLQPSGIIFFPLIFVALITLFRANLQLILLTCIGFIVPVFYVYISFFLTGNFALLQKTYTFFSYHLFPFSALSTWSWERWLLTSSLVLISGVSMLYILYTISQTVVHIRNIYYILMWSVPAGLFAIFFMGGIFPILFLFFPLSIFLSVFISGIKHRIFAGLAISALILPLSIYYVLLT